jgi:hypothetical protein
VLVVMERQQILETPGSAYPPEPRFDEERTVLSARPVVPLVELNAKTGSRGWLFLTTGIAFAVLLGACAAILMVYLEQRRVEPIKSVSSQPADTQQTENVSAQADTFGVSSPNETANTLSNDPPVTPGKRHQAEKMAIAQKTSVSSKQPEMVAATPDRGSEGDVQSISDRETSREQRWEERRLRRDAWRDRRDTNRDPNADLFRIREIFEGTSNPH